MGDDSFLDRVARRQAASANHAPSPGIGSPYATEALRREADALANTSNCRNQTLNDAVYNIAGFITTGELSENDITGAFTAAARTASARGDHPLTDDEIRRTIRSALDGAKKKNRVRATPPRNANSNGHPVADEPRNSHRVQLIAADTIRDDVPMWAWSYQERGRIQLGTLALFAGRPGAGKSTAARWFAAQASTGQLEGHWHGQPQNVAYIAPAEESWRYVIKPGLRAAGADMTRIFNPEVHNDDGEQIRLLSLRDEGELTEQFLAADIKIVIVDPIMSTVSANIDIHRNNEVRAYIEPWARIADRIDGIVIGVAHLRKQATGDLVAAVTGSSAFGEVARAIFGFVKDPDSEEGERIMSQSKNSTGYEDLALTYMITPASVRTDSGNLADVGTFVITGVSEMTAEQVLNTGMIDSGQGAECRKWLRDYLEAGGTVASRDVKADGRKEGFSEAVMKRMAAKLKVVITSEGFPCRTYWRLPGQLDHSGRRNA